MAEPGTGKDGPRVLRVRHELHSRSLTVLRVERPAPQMVRVILGGPELAGFTSLGFDDHVKLFVPAAGGGGRSGGVASGHSVGPGQEGLTMRDFTPRRHDSSVGELWIEIYLHEAGPAAAWAAQAAPGQSLVVGGPRGSSIIEIEDIDYHVLIGDETALPAIHRRLEELPPGARALVLGETDPGAAWPAPVARADVDVRWVARDGQRGPPAHELLASLRSTKLPPGRSFFWVACESRAARAIRRYLLEERGIAKRWIKAAGYWQRGSTGSHEHIED